MNNFKVKTFSAILKTSTKTIQKSSRRNVPGKKIII